jgi:hypothetical protein
MPSALNRHSSLNVRVTSWFRAATWNEVAAGVTAERQTKLDHDHLKGPAVAYPKG